MHADQPAEFTDPQLVAIYDTVNPYDDDAQPSFFRSTAAEVSARTVLDVGCGTGLITLALADLGYSMIGVDPSGVMLAAAAAKSGGDRVRWIEGGAADLPALNADLAIMSGHVAQFFLSDDSWDDALRGIRRALRSDGTLAFESRDPRRRAWEQWPVEPQRTVIDPTHGPIETWTTVDGVAEFVVTYRMHYRFVETGVELEAPCHLRFRTAEELTRSLERNGFTVESIHGDWTRIEPDHTTPELIVTAIKR